MLAGHGLAVPKDPHTGALKALLIARRGAVEARTAAIQQIKDLLITAPAELRERYHRYSTNLRLVEALARCRPTAHENPTTVSVLIACKALAQRIEYLERQDRDLSTEIDALTTAINPALRAAYGVGPDTAAQLIITAGTNAHRLHSEAAFARLAGTAPIPASSGKTTRHRLSRGGDRAANNALHRIALVRWSHDPHTRDYATRQLTAGRSKKTSCACSNAPSPARCSNTSPTPAPSTTTATYAPPDRPATSPSPPPPNTSTCGPTTSPDSNAASNATTPSPTPTANGSTPNSSTLLDRLTEIGASPESENPALGISRVRWKRLSPQLRQAQPREKRR